MATLNYNSILLVHPLGYPARSAQRDISRIANLMPPIGLASIAAYLKACRREPYIVDCFAYPDSDRLIAEYLQSQKPAFIGLSCTTSSFMDGIRIARMAKAIVPAIRTVFGGPHVSALREKLLIDFQEIDFGVVGEGEETVAELMQGGGDGCAQSGGLVHRVYEEVRFNGYRSKSLDLDSLPFPAYDRLAGFPHAYSLPIFNYPTTPNTSCISSRGCPYSCSYCDRSVYRRSFRFNSAKYVYEHLTYLRRRFGIRHINFYDDQFTFNRDRIHAFTRLLIEKPLGMTYNCAVRAEHVDLDLLQQMKASGCWMVSLGIESGDESLLSRHRQNPDLEMLAEKIRLIKKTGMRVKGLLMIGLPGETEASIRKSMKYVFGLRLDDLNISKFTPFPGSPLYADIKRHGAFEEDWSKMDCMHFLFIPEGLTIEQLEFFFKDFYRRHFRQLHILWGYITMLWRSPSSWRRFLRNLVPFIRFARSNRRIGRLDADARRRGADHRMDRAIGR